mgnify:CR=1 FL=1
MSSQPSDPRASLQAIHADRRRRLRDVLGPGCVVVVPARPERLRNGNAEYRYRQTSDLWWLTGFPEPEAVAVLSPDMNPEEALGIDAALGRLQAHLLHTRLH